MKRRVDGLTCQNSWGKSPWACNVLRSVNVSSSEDDSPSSVVESSEPGDVARLLILTALEDLKKQKWFIQCFWME